MWPARAGAALPPPRACGTLTVSTKTGAGAGASERRPRRNGKSLSMWLGQRQNDEICNPRLRTGRCEPQSTQKCWQASHTFQEASSDQARKNVSVMLITLFPEF